MPVRVASLYAEIGANLTPLSRGLQDAKDKIRDAGQAMQGLGSSAQQLQERLNRVGQEAQSAGIALGAIAAAGTALLRVLGLTASRTEELGLAMFTVGKNMGYTEGELLAAVDTIKQLGITTQVAQEMVTRFAQLELDMADAAKIARAAQDMAVIGMEDSSTAADRMTTAIARQWPILLRQYGIYEGLEDIYERHARTLGKSADSLTELEKRQAFVNTILEEASKYSGVYEAAMTSASKQIRSFSRYTQELANAYGQYLLPAMGYVVEKLTDLVKWLTALPEEVKRTAVLMVGLGTAASAVGAGMLLAIAAISKFASALLNIPRLIADLTALFVGKTKALEAQTVAENAAATSAGVLKAALLGLLTPLSLIAVGLIAVSSQGRTLQSDLAAQEKAIRDTAQSYHEYITSLQAAYGNLIKFYEEVGVTVEKIDLMDRGIALSREEWEKWRISTSEAVEALAPILKGLDDVRSGALGTVEALREASIGWESFKYAATDLGTGMLGLSQVEWDIAQSHLEFQQQITQLAAEAAQKRKEAAEQVAEAEEQAARRITAAQSLIASGYQQLIQTTAGYQQQMTDMAEQFAWDRQMAEIERTLAAQEAYAQHYQTLANAEAQYQAQLLELQRKGKTDEIAQLQMSHQEELAQINWRFQSAQAQASYAYQKQEALAELHHAREIYLQAVATKAQLEQQLAQYKEESRLWLLQHEALFEGHKGYYEALLYLTGQYNVQMLIMEGKMAQAHAAVEKAKAEASKESALIIAKLTVGVIAMYKAAIAAAQGAIAEAEAGIAAALAKIKSIKIDLPAVPDWSKFVPDFAPEFKKISKNAEKATQDVTRSVSDFAGMITSAIDALIKLAGFEAPTRIQEGARQLEDVLVSLVPMLRRLKDALDAAVSVESLHKIGEFAKVIVSLAEAMDALNRLAGYISPEEYKMPFANLASVMIELARALDYAQETWDRFVLFGEKGFTIAQIQEIKLFAETVLALVNSFEALSKLEELPALSHDWLERVFAPFMDNFAAMVHKMAELATPGFRENLYTVVAMADTMEKVGRAIQSILEAILAIESYWLIPNLSAMIERFVADVRTLFAGLAGIQTPGLTAGGAGGGQQMIVIAPIVLDARQYTTASGEVDYWAVGEFLREYEGVA